MERQRRGEQRRWRDGGVIHVQVKLTFAKCYVEVPYIRHLEQTSSTLHNYTAEFYHLLQCSLIRITRAPTLASPSQERSGLMLQCTCTYLSFSVPKIDARYSAMLTIVNYTVSCNVARSISETVLRRKFTELYLLHVPDSTRFQSVRFGNEVNYSGSLTCSS